MSAFQTKICAHTRMHGWYNPSAPTLDPLNLRLSPWPGEQCSLGPVQPQSPKTSRGLHRQPSGHRGKFHKVKSERHPQFHQRTLPDWAAFIWLSVNIFQRCIHWMTCGWISVQVGCQSQPEKVQDPLERRPLLWPYHDVVHNKPSCLNTSTDLWRSGEEPGSRQQEAV